jgi:hypothetical protein
MARGGEPTFWQSNTAHLLQAAIADAKDAIASVKHPPHSEMALGMLYTVVLEFAARAHGDPELRSRMGLRGDFPRRPRNGLAVPMMTLRHDNVWVRRETAAGATVQPWDVFGADGAHRGVESVPMNKLLVAITKRFVYVSRTDRDDLRWLEAYAR